MNPSFFTFYAALSCLCLKCQPTDYMAGVNNTWPSGHMHPAKSRDVAHWTAPKISCFFCCSISKTSSASAVLHPPDQGLPLDLTGGTVPDPQFGPLCFRKYFWHYLINKLCSPAIWVVIVSWAWVAVQMSNLQARYDLFCVKSAIKPQPTNEPTV